MKLLVLFLFLFTVVSSQWIDPHDMNTNHKKKYGSMTTSVAINGERECLCEKSNESEIQHLVYMKRMVGLLLNAANLDKSNPYLFTGSVVVNINNENYDFLVDFVNNGKIDKHILRKIDEILSDSLQRNIMHEYLDTFDRLVTKIINVIFNRKTAMLSGVALMLFLASELYRNSFSLTFIMKYMIMIVLITDYGFRYIHLLEEAEEQNFKAQHSGKCDAASWIDWVKSLVSTKEECQRVTVTPLTVLLYQVKNLIIVPMQSFGTGFGGFGRNLFGSLPYPMNLLLGPILLIMGSVMMLMVIALYTGAPLEFSVLYSVLNIRFNSERESSLRQLLNTVHRPMIQDVHPGGSNQSDSTKIDKKKTCKEDSGSCDKSEETSKGNELKSIKQTNPEELNSKESSKEVQMENPSANKNREHSDTCDKLKETNEGNELKNIEQTRADEVCQKEKN